MANKTVSTHLSGHCKIHCQLSGLVVRKGFLAVAVATCSMLPLLFGDAPELSSLAAGFQSPPDTAKPYTWWHWLHGNVTRDGITCDLEAMKGVGLGGAQIFHATDSIPGGPVTYLSPEWRDLMTHAIKEADRLGLKLGMHNCGGWSSTGGPWITPELAMQVLVWTETRITGPNRFDAILPQPFTRKGFYRDAAVFAFLTPPADKEDLLSLQAIITTSDPKQDAGKLVDRDRNTTVTLPKPNKENPPIVQIEFPKPFRAQALSIVPGFRFHAHGGELQAKTADGEFRKICDFKIPYAGNAQTYLGINFPPTTSRVFRLVFTIPCRYMNTLVLAEIDLHGGFRIDRWRDKGGYTHYNHQADSPCRPAPADVIEAKDIIDLTARVSSDGHLVWDAPAGDWTILRIGHTPTGTFNKPASKAATGLECDKFNKAALDVHWRNLIEVILQDAGPWAGKSFNNIHIDSFEVGTQNWTEDFPEEFRKRRGYDILPFLPILTGRVVADLETSERFLWDMRKTCAELFRDNYFQYSAELCRKHGLIFSVEGYGESNFDWLPCSRTGHMPMGEFWVRNESPDSRNKLASSAAHLTGEPIVGSEAFTAHAEYGGWRNHPYSLKVFGDLAFCSGINRLIFHRYAHQPWNDRRPGMTMGPHGFHFERTITWWKQAPAWTSYLARCQYLLQQGGFVADVCCFIGEDSPTALNSQRPPSGYDYDFCDAESIMQMSVRDGLLVHPSGMEYRLLTIPADDTGMTLPLLRKLRQLVQDGASVYGPRPTSSSTLEGYPGSDAEVRALADELWKNCDGGNSTVNCFGKGRVFCGKSINRVLAEDLKLSPDFTPGKKQSQLAYIHRRTEKVDFYFVSNRARAPISTTCEFRITGKKPSLWWPETAEMEAAPVYDVSTGQTRIPLSLGPAESVFVVFSGPISPGPHVTELTPDLGTDTATLAMEDENLVVTAWEQIHCRATLSDGRDIAVDVTAPPPPVPVDGPWRLTFPPDWGAPPEVTLPQLISWPDHSDPGVRYFSGTATYYTTFDLPQWPLSANLDARLDLGDVQVIAEVCLNGNELGIFWKPPFRVDVANVLKKGTNTLEVRVTNLWPNRLIGDEFLPDNREWNSSGALKRWPDDVLKGQPPLETGRVTWTTWRHYTTDSPLLPSGLLGPVKLQFGAREVLYLPATR